MKRVATLASMIAALTASAAYQYILDPGQRPAKPTAVFSTEVLAAGDVVGGTTTVSEVGGADWFYRSWMAVSDEVLVRRDKISTFMFMIR